MLEKEIVLMKMVYTTTKKLERGKEVLRKGCLEDEEMKIIKK